MSGGTQTLTSATQSHGTERGALNKVTLFGILQLSSIVAGWVVGFYVLGSLPSAIASLGTNPSPTPAQVSAALGPFFQTITLVIPVTIAIDLIAIIALTIGLRDFKRLDNAGFSVPSILMLFLIAGTLLAAAGVIPLFNSIPDMIAKAPNTPGGAPSTAFLNSIGSFLLDLALVGLGGVLGLVGIVGGVILGLWRVGSRYDETLLKVGAILTIIPLANLAAPILVIIGAYQSKGKLPISG